MNEAKMSGASKFEPLRVCIVGYSFSRAGSEVVAATMAEALKSAGHEITYVSASNGNGPIREQLEAAGIPCFCFFSGSFSIRDRVAAGIAFGRWLKKSKIDILHFHHFVSLNRYCAALLVRRPQQVVLTEHTDHELQTKPRYRYTSILTARLCDSITAIHERLARSLESLLHLDVDSVTCVPNGIDVTSAEASRRIPNSREHDPGLFRFVFVGRLHPDKDVSTLLSAFSHLNRTLPACELVIVGDGEERQALAEKARLLGIERAVVFVGHSTDVFSWLASSDAFVMSSKTEGVPLALLEAMSFGLPCVATSVGGIDALLAREAGIVVPPTDVRALESAMRRVATSADLRQRLGRAAKATVISTCALEKSVKTWLEIYTRSTDCE
jgi:glycosyltransferase involved in cell wall biosynthesis